MNYFEFFNLEEAFHLDESALKKQYLANSRKYHPDFYTLDGQEAQEKALELSSLNNEAYNTLKDFNKRLHYILQLNDVLEDESLMELEMEPDEELLDKVRSEVSKMSKSLLKSVSADMDAYPEADSDQRAAILEKVKDYYLKNKYLARIGQRLK